MKYTTKVRCKNCGHESWIETEKGTTIKEFCLDEGRRCDYCDCLLFEEKEEKEQK